MEFWGVEIKPGQRVKVEVKDDYFLHLTQCALVDVKEGVTATMFVKVNGQKLAIGTLSFMTSMFQYDLVFEKEFELSHNSKSSSVCFSGYNVFQPAEGDKKEDDYNQGAEKKITTEVVVETPASDNKPIVATEKSDDNKRVSTKEDDPNRGHAGKNTSAEVVVKTPSPDRKPNVSKEKSDDNKRVSTKEDDPNHYLENKRSAEGVEKTPSSYKKQRVATENSGTKRGAHHEKKTKKKNSKKKTKKNNPGFWLSADK